VHPVPGTGPRPDPRQQLLGDRRVGLAHVHRHACGLNLKHRPGLPARNLSHCVDDPGLPRARPPVKRVTNPMSNSEPWLPMRCTSPGSRDIAASSRRARPEMTAVAVAGNMASDRSADAASGSGRTDHRSLVIGASVPS
jgi:hypothetical protein